jgi:NAD(P)-dependent dehydrogenase (short-subunit alcohol dehydrogenase family)
MNNLIPLYPLDLTKLDQIHLIATTINEGVRKAEFPSLYAIINVAGGGQIAPIELINIVKFIEELQKRLVGPISLLQELLPLLRSTKGRIFWIATPGLLPVPYVADIHACDFAVNYLARTLNLELRPDGIKNILIRCGGINTSSSQRTVNDFATMLNHWPKDGVNIYKYRLIRLQKYMLSFNAKRTDPEKVAVVISKVLNTKNPKVRYQVGYMSNLGSFLEMLPQSWVDFIMGKRES